MLKNNKTKSKKKGFTLIEMMVSVSIFVIVAFIVVSTLLTLSYSYKKAQKLRILMDNLGFSIQSMSINIREGVNYSQPSVCASDKSCIEFKPIDSWLGLSGNSDDLVRYYLEDSSIKKCPVVAGSCFEAGILLTSPEIKIKSLKFIFDTSPSQEQKKVKIMIDGEAGTVPREKSTFFIQNTISQRSIGD